MTRSAVLVSMTTSVVLALAIYAAVSHATGRIDVDGGRGWVGAEAFAIARHGLGAADGAMRLQPFVPLAAGVVSRATGEVLPAFRVLNLAWLALLALAADWLLIQRGVAPAGRVLAVGILAGSIATAKLAAFYATLPWLGVAALVMLACAAAVADRRVLAAAAATGAALAAPVGVGAAVFGVVRDLRLRRSRLRILTSWIVPVLAFAALQVRAFVAGGWVSLFDGLRLWTEPGFVAWSAYFAISVAGGLTLLVASRPATIRRLTAGEPEWLALAAPAVLVTVFGTPDIWLPWVACLPLVLVAFAGWWHDTLADRRWWPVLVAIAFTVVTQAPLARLDVARYFADWFPYRVAAGDAPVTVPDLLALWTPRWLLAVAAVGACLVRLPAMLLDRAGLGFVRTGASWARFIFARLRQGAEQGGEVLVTAGLRVPRGARALVSGLSHASEVTWPAATGRALAIRVEPGARLGGRWFVVSIGLALITAATVGWFITGIPIQLTDCVVNLLDVQEGTVWSVTVSKSGNAAFFRPLLWTALKVAYDLSGGHYFAVFKGIHVVQVGVLLVLAVRLLRPREAWEVALVPLALALLIGSHTFAGMVLEGFPINTYMTIAICCFAAAALSFARGGWWIDVAAALLCVFAVFTVESGLLVWVVLCTGYLAGSRSVSWRGIAMTTLVVAGYFYVRFAVLHIGSPGLIERSSGFGLQVLDPPDLIARFGTNPWPFYAYNIVASVLDVLFAEPRAGAFVFAHAIVGGTVAPWMVVNVVASTLATLVLFRYVALRFRRWLRWTFDDGDRLVLMFFGVLAANATISYAYTKSTIMSPAGIFYALAVAVALRDWVVSLGDTSRRTVARAMAAAAIVVLSTTWSLRAAAIHFSLRHQGEAQRREWAFVPEGPETPALTRHFKAEALWTRPAPWSLDLPASWFDVTQ